MISGRDIICISSIEWGFLWQCPQEIAWRLAQNGNRVLYIENSGVRAPGLRDAGRVWRRLVGWARTIKSQGVREVAPNVYVCSPLVMPPFGGRWQERLNRHLLLPAVRRAARRLGMREALLWTYLPTDTANNLIELLREPQSVLVYYCLADFSKLTPNVEQLRRSERRTIEMSDVVFTNCAQLSAYCGQWHGSVHVFPPGVNLEAFPLDAASSTIQHVRNSTTGAAKVDAVFGPTPDAMFAPASASTPRLPSPVIGYVGGLHRFVDMDLLIEMARARTAWSWVFVGSCAVDASKLSALPNVRLLGQQPHKDLNKYLRGFDACIVPYLIAPETETVVPTKINEYLAAGKPVVSTQLPTVLAFNAEHGAIVGTAEAQTEPFLQAIEQALATSQQPEARARRREVAALNDWQARLEAMSDLIERELGKKR